MECIINYLVNGRGEVRTSSCGRRTTHKEAWQAQINEICRATEGRQTSEAQRRAAQVLQEANHEGEEQKEAWREAEERSGASKEVSWFQSYELPSTTG